jgi:hypothetical protein
VSQPTLRSRFREEVVSRPTLGGRHVEDHRLGFRRNGLLEDAERLCDLGVRLLTFQRARSMKTSVAMNKYPLLAGTRRPLSG